jgi:hypothetical protein
VIGCGAIGSFVAVELARAGFGFLTVFDKDLVEPGNSVRWVVGREFWGISKAAALKSHLLRNYPFTEVDAYSGFIGGATTSEKDIQGAPHNPVEELRRMIREADVVIDASASTECQQAVAFQCRDLGKPLVLGYATEGAAGGVVARFRADSGFCAVCLSYAWDSLPQPTVDATGTVLPVGCNAPTFTGGAFDLQEVSLEIVRSAIGLVAPGMYGPGDWDLAILSLRDAQGRRQLPGWRTAAIPPHAQCCARAAA